MEVAIETTVIMRTITITEETKEKEVEAVEGNTVKERRKNRIGSRRRVCKR